MQPSAARCLAAGGAIVLVHAVSLALGLAASHVARDGLPASLARLDALADSLTAHFEPALAPGLLAAFGPGGSAAPVLVAGTLFACLVVSLRRLPAALLALAIAALLAREQAALLQHLVPSAAPILSQPDSPAAEWLGGWDTAHAFAPTHVLVVAGLAGVLGITWWMLLLPAEAIALLTALTAVYFGAARPTDVAAALLVGNAAAVAAVLVARPAWRLARAELAWLMRRAVDAWRNAPPDVGPPIPVAREAPRVR